MKKIERVTYESLFYGDDKIACAIAALSNKINELVDAHNELLETETKCACNKMGPCTYHYLHPKGETETVKEECRCRSGELKTGGKWASWSKDNCPVHPDKSPFDKEEPTIPEKQKIQCLCPAWFSDGEGGHVKNTRKDHVKGECPLANVENELATPEKKPSEKIGEILCKIMDGYTHPDDVDWNHERVNAVVAYLDEQYKKK